jgi:chromosome segregation ATPase
MTTATDDLTTLRERRRQLSDRAEELKAAAVDILADVSSAEQDWLDAVELGEDAGLLAERTELGKRELSDNRRATDHLEALLAGIDAQIADIEARERLTADLEVYSAARLDYSASLDSLPAALPTAVEAVSTALTELLERVEGARTAHDQLAGTAVQLGQRASLVGVDADVAEPPSWSGALERAYPKDTPSRNLMLSVIQRRGAHSVLAEIEQLIRLQITDQRRSLR